MDIRLVSLMEGARAAEGTVVVIDVYRAFTVAAYAFVRGLSKIIMIPGVHQALEARARKAGDFCSGEVDGKMPPGFDFGNSPFELAQAEVKGRTMIQSTRAGVVGAASVAGADTVYGCAFVNAAATASAIRRLKPELVTLVAMGWAGQRRSDEDELCALYLRNLIEGRQPSRDALRTLVLAGGESQKFGDPAQPHFHAEDRDMALRIDSIPIAIRIRNEDGWLVARQEG